MKKVGIGMVVFMLALCWSATAAVIVQETFDANDGGWVLDANADGSAGGTASSSGAWDAGGGNGFFRIDSGDANGGNTVEYAFDSGGTFAGDYRSTANGGGGLAGNGINGISFSFYNPAATAIPELQVYLIAGGNTWYHGLTSVTDVNGWGVYGANLSYDSLNAGTGNWFTLAGDDLATWQGDLANVTGMGFRMLYDTSANQIYGLDNIVIQDDPYILLVPEPQTYAMLGFAFLSLGVTFRRRLEDALSSLKAMVA